MDITVGVCAYNEGKNLGNLIEKMFKISQKNYSIKEVIIVSDGSTDNTNDIIHAYEKKSRKIRGFARKQRYGKVNAINLILAQAKTPIIILESADNIPDDEAYEKLLEPFKDNNIGITCSHIIPVNKGNDFMVFLGRFMYKLHHEIASKMSKYGELIAFRNVIKRIPNNAVDEEFIAMLIVNQGYKGKYCPDAIVYNKAPTTIKDFLKQRRRIYAGHLALKKRYKFHVPTVSNSAIFFQIMNDKKYLFRNCFWILLAISLELYGRFLGFMDVYIIKKNHCKWDIADSTKNPTI